MLTVLDIDGVDSRSAAVFAPDCHFPVTDLRKHLEPDDVFTDMPVFLGAWANNTVAPQVTDQWFDITTAPQTANACEPATVKAYVTTCDLVAPNMRRIYIGSASIDWEEARLDYCRRRNILPRQLQVWDSNGRLDMGSPYALDFAKFTIASMAGAFSKVVVRSAVKGDDANLLEFDGLYTQLAGGWTASGGRACPATINVEQTINWSLLTGGLIGGVAYPDQVTVAGQSITIWGTSYTVPAGLNLAQFLEDLWLDKVEREYADRFGGVDMFEVHVPWGGARCIINAAGCMQPCSNTSAYDVTVRERIAELRSKKIMRLYPSDRVMAVKESRYMPANTLRVGPRSIGGKRTYGLFFDDLVGNSDMWEDTYGQNAGLPGQEDALLALADELRLDFDNNAILWDVRKKSAVCLDTSIVARAGFLAAARHLWLRVTNVGCSTIMSAPSIGLKLDTVSLN